LKPATRARFRHHLVPQLLKPTIHFGVGLERGESVREYYKSHDCGVRFDDKGCTIEEVGCDQ